MSCSPIATAAISSSRCPTRRSSTGSHDAIRTDREGYVHAPGGPGLGIELDWQAIESAAIMTYEVR